MGYMIVPSEQKALFNALKAAGTHTFTCAPSPIQHALAEVVYCVYLYTIFYYHNIILIWCSRHYNIHSQMNYKGLYDYKELDEYMILSRFILSQAGRFCVR